MRTPAGTNEEGSEDAGRRGGMAEDGEVVQSESEQSEAEVIDAPRTAAALTVIGGRSDRAARRR